MHIFFFLYAAKYVPVPDFLDTDTLLTLYSRTRRNLNRFLAVDVDFTGLSFVPYYQA
jgi:hypothetical protein